MRQQFRFRTSFSEVRCALLIIYFFLFQIINQQVHTASEVVFSIDACQNTLTLFSLLAKF